MARPAAVAGWAGLSVAAAAIGATALAGPSAAEAPLGTHAGATPPFHLDAHPSAWLVTALPAGAVAAGVAALLLVLTRRWRPDPRRLMIAGAVVTAVLALLPPIGSADPISYASYGRMVVTGHDAYTTAPAELADHDPVAAAVEPPWQHEPSVYGPLATGEQAVVAAVGGADPARVVWLLGLLNAAAFIGVGLLLLRRASEPEGRLRAAALWSANPLLWLVIVAGAHLDVLVAAVATAAVVVGLRRPLAGAALAGVAATVKPPGGLVWLAVAWPLRRRPGRLAAAAAVAAAVVVAAYAAVTPEAERQLSRAARRVSHATPWRPLLDSGHVSRSVIGVLALALAAALAVLLARRRGTVPVAAIAVAVTTAYVLAAPYALAWYDAVPWALLPLAAASWRDSVLLAHTSVLALAYVPGRDAVPLHGTLHAITSTMRNDIAPVALAALVVATVVLAVSRRGGPAGSG